MTPAKTISSVAAAALLGAAVYVSLPDEPACRVLSFDNPNGQVVEATVQSSTNLLDWRTETNWLAQAGPNEWRDYDVNRPAKFYRVNFHWWY